MNTVLARIHMGLMGSAFQHATYGWFGISAAEMEFVFLFSLGLSRSPAFSAGIKKSPVEIEA